MERGFLVTGGKIDVRMLGVYGPQAVVTTLQRAEGDKPTRKIT